MLERLQKIISRAGISSRRHAEELIRSGQVRVNGVIVTELGAKADPDHDRIEAAGKVAQPAETGKVYLLLNKPIETVSTMADPEGRRTLRHLLVGVAERVFLAGGGLEYSASGAVFLTNDGDLASRLLKAVPYLRQTFWIKVKGRLTEEQMSALAATLKGTCRMLRAPRAAGKHPANAWYEVQWAGIQDDALRKALSKISHPVEKLKRIQLGPLDIEAVPEGKYTRLAAGDVDKLQRAINYAIENRAMPPSAAPNHRPRGAGRRKR
jgi:23S rRNA pseudouridine2605 synthase